MKYSQKNTDPNFSIWQDIYNWVYSAQDLLNNKKIVEEKLITTNLLYIKEYYSLVKTDFNDGLLLNKDNSNAAKNSCIMDIKNINININNNNFINN